MRCFESRFYACFGMLLLAALAFPPLRAQNREPAVPAVAHVASLNGQASLRHGGDGEWVALAAGTPLVAGDQLVIGAKGRADVRFDSTTIFRAESGSVIHLAEPRDGRYRLELQQGALSCNVLGPSGANVDVSTPSVTVRPSPVAVPRRSAHGGPRARFRGRIALNEDGESEISVRGGYVEVVAPRGSEWVYPGQGLIARGPAADPEYRYARITARWKRALTIAAAAVQIGSDISGSMPSSSGNRSQTAGSTHSSPPSRAPAPVKSPEPPHSSPPAHTTTASSHSK